MAKRRVPTNVPQHRLEAYERLVATQPGVERKGASVPYTSSNGHMTSFVDATGVAIRLGPTDRETFIERYGARLHQAYGATMKDFVTVPDDVLEDLPAAAGWFARGLEFVAGLPPKTERRQTTLTRGPRTDS